MGPAFAFPAPSSEFQSFRGTQNCDQVSLSTNSSKLMAVQHWHVNRMVLTQAMSVADLDDSFDWDEEDIQKQYSSFSRLDAVFK